MNFAQEKNPRGIIPKIGINHLDFEHEFIAKDFSPWGVGIEISYEHTEDIETPTTKGEETAKLIKTFTKTVEQFSTPSRIPTKERG